MIGITTYREVDEVACSIVASIIDSSVSARAIDSTWSDMQDVEDAEFVIQHAVSVEYIQKNKIAQGVGIIAEIVRKA